MAEIKIRGQSLDVDVAEELSAFEWNRPRWAADKLIAGSPFRYDKTPSFFVNLETGGFHDSGAYDSDYESGNLVKLLAFLRDETYEETAEYLTALYGVSDNADSYVIPTLSLPKGVRQPTVLDESILADFRYRSPYLGKRGITERTQRFLGVGYSHKHRAVVIPWRHPNGTLANIKYRKTRGKAFWYEKGAEPIRKLIYGLDAVYSHSLSTCFVCEAEIDAMSLYSAGKPAVAIGGASVSKAQLEALKKSPIERLIIATDNDKAGDKVKRQLIEGLRGYVDLAALRLPAGVKDVNEALVNGVLDVDAVEDVGALRKFERLRKNTSKVPRM